ncbi:hypothetical protein DNTS_032568, partial [Danionella cerebrum]
FFRLTLLIPTDIITEHSGVHQGGRSPVLLALFRCSSSTSFGSISSEQHTHQRAAPFLDLPVEEEQIEKFQPFILLKSFLPPILGVATDGLRSSRSQQEEFLKSSQWWLSASSASEFISELQIALKLQHNNVQVSFGLRAVVNPVP